MQEEQHREFRRLVAVWRRRNAFRRGLVRWVWFWVVAALVGLFSLGVVWAFPGLRVDVPVYVPGVVLLLSGLSWFGAALPERDVVQMVDLRGGGRTLLVTGFGLLSRKSLSVSEVLCLEDALVLAQSLDPSRVAPLWPLRALRGLALPVLVFALMATLPLPDLPLAPATEHVEEPLPEEVAKRVENALQGMLAASEKLDPEVRKRLRRLQKRLKERALTQDELLEELGAVREALRQAEAAKARESSKAARGLQGAAASLRGQEDTRALGRALQKGASGQSKTGRPRDIEAETRKLETLEAQRKKAAAEALKRAAREARDGGANRAGDALSRASDALESGDPAALRDAAEALAEEANRRILSEREARQMQEALDRAKAAASGGSRPSQGGAPSGDGEGQGSGKGPRRWSRAGGGDKKDGMGAGHAHNPEESSPSTEGSEHMDASRVGEQTPEAWKEAYQELYEARLLNTGGKNAVRLKGKKGAGAVDVLTGGTQKPEAGERARKILRKLPAGYSDGVRKGVGQEEVPPDYREAVRAYFDTGR